MVTLEKRHLSVIGRYRLYCQRLFCRLFDEKHLRPINIMPIRLAMVDFRCGELVKCWKITNSL